MVSLAPDDALEVKKKNGWKKLQPFQEDVAATALSPTKLFQPYLIASQSRILEVVIFQRAGAESVAAANR